MVFGRQDRDRQAELNPFFPATACPPQDGLAVARGKAFYAEIVMQLGAQKTAAGPALPRKHPRHSMPLGDAVEQVVLVRDSV